MIRLAIAYICTAVIFIVLDGGFLSLVGPKLYRPEIGSLLGGSVRLTPAVLFYLLYIAGLVYFCVRPTAGQVWSAPLIAGAMLGLVAYGTYDLTCHSVMKVWSWKVTLIDMAWGMIASALAATGGSLATAALAAKFGIGA
jgi:uncharacterized membrane protein